jgi:hypothetical protein
MIFPFSGIPDIDHLSQPLHVLVITGGHEYNMQTFNEMLDSFGPAITFSVAEFPEAFDYFLPENRSKYDVLLFYHMWQTIAPEQAKNMAECIKGGKPVVVLHHSICAFDDWNEYRNIIGGKYFHKVTTVEGKEFKPSTYKHDVHYRIYIEDQGDYVTQGIKNFELFDETYKGFFVDEKVKVLLTTDDSTSNPVIGWTKMYGNARIVTIQPGHDTPTYRNESFRKLLLQAIKYVLLQRRMCTTRYQE